MTAERFEWRVRWRRASWQRSTATKSRAFAREHDATVFIARLEAAPDHSPVVLLEVSKRTVGDWQPANPLDLRCCSLLRCETWR